MSGPSSHPLTNEYWGYRTRGCPLDELRCDECGGFLSFEYHEAWHKIKLHNDFRLADKREKDEKARAREDSGKLKGWAKKPPPTIL